MLEIGSTGLEQTAGVIEGENRIPELRAERAIKTYEKMRNDDPTIGGVLFAVKQIVKQATWTVEPGSEDAGDEEAREFVETCMGDMSHTWDELVGEALSVIPFGFSVHELVYKLRGGPVDDPERRSRFDDGRVGWRKIPIRAQTSVERWLFEEDGGLAGVVQNLPNGVGTAEIPIHKLLLFRVDPERGNPQGRSLLRSAYRPWYFKRRIENLEGIGIERDLAGLPVMWVPPDILEAGADSKTKQAAEHYRKLIRNVRRDEQEGLLLPLVYDSDGNKAYDIELLSTGGRRQFDTTAIIKRYDQRILGCMMAQVLQVGQDKVGSFALAESLSHLFLLGVKAIMGSITTVVNRIAIPRLLALNPTLRVAEHPRIVHSEIEATDLKALGEFLKAMAMVGLDISADEAVENYLRRVSGLPERSTLQ